MKKVTTEKELGEALKNEESTIEITGDLAKKTIKLRATGNVAWAIAIGAIAIAAYGIIAAVPSGGSGALVSGIAAPAAVGVLGGAVTYSAIAIAVAAGGVGALTALRGYKEVSRTENSITLKRR
ncbi:hypothetical protein K0W38_004425 [Vibrio vulnificus]|uniref:hypothetical protein n=1 Tax=Vibrio TaxID=662 RepID=UPI0002F0B16D|nr:MULTISPECIES: hypothetical protein [Vibrio]EHK9018668.1 hypothetical protein [Vibrio vulnificus]EKO3802401.1 hypothetical protein [Vibrio harveyi]EHU4998392.1 hypothetical protein [Vibrio vulnificus]EHV5553133.1 hypothetical protein [Vibrio vulnificus]HAS8600586.1 hypothetical protein [Vibrio vulnificus]